jgi:hypothetical protein
VPAPYRPSLMSKKTTGLACTGGGGRWAVGRRGAAAGW